MNYPTPFVDSTLGLERNIFGDVMDMKKGCFIRNDDHTPLLRIQPDETIRIGSEYDQVTATSPLRDNNDALIDLKILKQNLGKRIYEKYIKNL